MSGFGSLNLNYMFFGVKFIQVKIRNFTKENKDRDL